ncbi:FG-GAP-like repeat-containing protein [Methanolobus sp. ZRKC2]|uniref:FG-GAP-like repeat-containing protein n=1 Tax=Methanolobus sp. ZRKC2 TaxID=3125783 RepID=UPI00324EBAC1
MIVILLAPNAYCLENTDTEQDVNAENTQLDSGSNADNDADFVDKEEETEKDPKSENILNIADSELESSQIEIMSSVSEPTEDPGKIVEGATNLLNPKIENNNDGFDTSLFTGSFVYTYPIETVRGKAGLEPKVSLTYSSSVGSKGTYGSLGMGWSLNDNCIYRDISHTTENTNDDKFYLILDGSTYELVYVEDDDSFHTETESFLHITKSITNTNSFGDYWIVKASDGTEYRFGYNDVSEQRNSVESRNYVTKWWLDLVEDVNGNQIQYNYIENPRTGELGSVYLDSIIYNDGLSIIDFEFIEKPNTFTLYEYGSKVIEKSLISNIKIRGNGSLLWNYEFDYQNENSKSFLTSISKTGINSESFPSTNFDYCTIGSWSSSSTWNPPAPFSGNGADAGTRLADVNGDGLVDIIRGYDAYNDKYGTWLNTGSGWSSSSTWNPPAPFSGNGADAGTRLADVNGDGLVDIIRGYDAYNDKYGTWLNTGSGWSSSSTWNPPVPFSGNGVDVGTRLADLNGDGLVDIIRGYDAYNDKYGTWLNTGSGWSSASTWNPPVAFSGNGADNGVRLADVNGDGLVDLLRGYNNGNGNTYLSAWLNTGDGWSSTSAWNPPTYFSYTGNDCGIRIADVNGDGLVDIIRGYDGYNDKYDAWLNTGNGWSSASTWKPPVAFSGNGADNGVRFADVNGDGLVDIIRGYDAYNDKYGAWINTNKNANPPSVNYKTPYLLSEINHSIGASTVVNYVPSTKFDNTGDDSIADLPLSMWVTSQLVRNNGISDNGNVVSTTDYTYKNGMQYFNPPEEIEFRGFGEVTVENDYSISKHFFHQDDVLKGIESQTEVWDKDGNIYSLSEMNYIGQQIHPDVNLILLNSESTTQFDGFAQSPDSSAGWSYLVEYEEYDDYGNPLSVTDHGDTDIIGDEKYLNYEYANEESLWIIGLKTHEWMEDSDYANESESWYYFDNSNDNSNINKGQLTKIVSWNNLGENPAILYDYDNYGNIIQITDPKGYSEDIEYDDNCIYPISIENALGQKEFYEYNDIGRITKVTDSNGVSTEYIYDDLHRIAKVVKPYDNVSSPSIEYTYYQDGLAPEKIHTNISTSKMGHSIQTTGDGTETSPFPIYSVSDLQDINNNLSAHYILMNDIDASATSTWNSGAGFVPIGTSTEMFTGSIDGNGYEIDGLTINRQWTNAQGFVAYLGDGGEIRNLGLTNVSVLGYQYVGSFTVFNHGTISNCFSTGSVIGGHNNVGGLVAGIYSTGSILDSYSMCAVTCAGTQAGGLSGFNNGNIQRCYAAGFVDCTNTKGGITGTNSNIVTDCYYDSQTTGCSDTGKGTPKTTAEMQTQSTFVGWDFNDTWDMRGYPKLSFTSFLVPIYSAFESVGSYDGFGNFIQKKYEGESDWIIQNTAYNELNLVESVEVPHYINQTGLSINYEYDAVGRPKIITNTDNTNLIYYYELENTTITNQNGVNKTLTSDIFGNIVNVHEFNKGDTYVTNYTYDARSNLIEIILNSSTTDDNPMQSIGSGTEASPFPIYSVSDLQDINNNLSAHYILMNDIDASATSTWNSGAGFVPIGTSTEMFIGSIDGNGYEIDDLTINKQWTNVQGFVAYLGDGGKIRNLGLTNVSVLGYQYVGSLAVFNHGTISNCFSTGNVTGGHNNVGGLAAGIYSTGSILDSYSMCAVTCAGTQAGGLSGFNNGNIQRCYATGFVDCTNTKGGITGTNSNTVTNCYYDSQTTGCSDTGKGTPKTTAEMQTQSTFVGWDFANTWAMDGYPKLKLVSSASLIPHVYFTYDSLGRKVAMNDPDMGIWTYEYDLNGNLISQTDARGVSIDLTYDALDRVTAIDYPSDDDVSFTYDLEYNGTLSQVTKGNIASGYDYDLRYRVEDETVTLDSTPYTTSYEYDSMDRPTRITYPNGENVNLAYNAQTQLESVEGVVDNLDYNARNQISTKELSNGVVTSYTYDTTKLLLDRIYTASLQDLNYDFDDVGNILEIEDNVLNSVKTYGYDDLDRLTSADMSVNSVPTYQRDFTYDPYGCIQQVDENSVTISSYGYAGKPFHAPVSYNGNTLDYDSNGNLVEDDDFTYSYNDANQLREVRYSGNSSLVEKYWYDADGQRVKKQNSDGEFTYYVNKFYEVDNSIPTSYFFRDDERIAKETAGDMEWYLSDHLGSTTLLIDESGLEVERTEYYPYGQVQSGGLEKYGFTGQENDADTDLMYYGARYYSPEYRVFVQPDTMLPDPYNPQYLNRYAYTLNNPVKYTDPSGHHPVILAVGAAGLLGGAISFGAQLYFLNGDFTKVDYREVGECTFIAVTGTAAGVMVAMETPALLAGTGLTAGQQLLVGGIVGSIVGSQASTMTSNHLQSNKVTENTIMEGNTERVAQDALAGGITEVVGPIVKNVKYLGKTRYPNTAKGLEKIDDDASKAYQKYFSSSPVFNDLKEAVSDNIISNTISEGVNSFYEWLDGTEDNTQEESS